MLQTVGLVFAAAILVAIGRVDLAQYLMLVCIVWTLERER